MSYAFYPGCSLESTAAEFAMSTRELCGALDVELHEVDDWVCCGASAAHIRSELMGVALPLINLAAAEKQNLDMMTCCSACHNRMKSSVHAFRQDPELLAKVNEFAEEDFKAETDVINILEVLAHEIGVHGSAL